MWILIFNTKMLPFGNPFCILLRLKLKYIVTFSKFIYNIDLLIYCPVSWKWYHFRISLIELSPSFGYYRTVLPTLKFLLKFLGAANPRSSYFCPSGAYPRAGV